MAKALIRKKAPGSCSARSRTGVCVGFTAPSPYAEETAEQDGLTILGIYHSHPDHPARPSAFDLERALPFYTYLITEVRSAAAVENRAWRLAEDRGSFEEESLTVVADQKEDR
jgi:proteasome lid subunit RPN8/RPN11